MKSYVLIIPNKIKKFIIKKVREKYFNYDIKFLSIEEFIKRCTFDYDNQAVYHVMKKYQMKYSSASVYLKNLPYIDDKIINSKMEFLKEIKKDLDDKKLLKYDYLFKESIKNKEIVLYGYDYLTKYQKKILSNYNYREIKITKVSYNLDKIFHAASIDDEVIFVANKISELIKNNVAINNIKVILWNEYEEVVSRIFELYHLPISIKRTSLYSSYTCKKVLNNLGNLEAVLETIEDSPLYEKIINVLNNYSFIENKEEVRELIENDFKKTYITNQIRDGIEVVSLDSYFSDDDYVFLLGYNKENLPKVQKDDDYFNDREKITLNLDTSTEINILEKEKTISNIRSIKNLTITTKDYSSTANYTISDLFDSLQIVEIENNTYVNSVIMNKIFLTEKLDNLVNYNIKDKDLDLLYSNYSSVPYRKYSNKFTGIEKDNLYKKLKNKLLLSYSSLNNYNQCKFKFYIARILEVKSGRDDFSKLIGNVCHYVLNISINTYEMKISWN